MATKKTEFVKLCVAQRALQFGRFELKSGRISPYFFNAGAFYRGASLWKLASHYADLIVARIHAPFMLYGPAYKGIPLAVATALQLAQRHDLDVGYAFHRKEAKDHGEGGNLVGAPLQGNVVIIDDVITAGISVRQSVAAIRAAGATPHAVVIALDRQETTHNKVVYFGDQVKSDNNGNEKYGMPPVHALIELDDLVDYWERDQPSGEFTAALRNYRSEYGAV